MDKENLIKMAKSMIVDGYDYETIKAKLYVLRDMNKVNLTDIDGILKKLMETYCE